MAKINTAQRQFLADILDKRMPVETAMEKNEITQRRLCEWFSMPAFADEVNKRIEFITKRADTLISQHRLTAVEKLVNLTSCDKEETARKACLDIIELTDQNKQKSQTSQPPPLSPQLAAKLLSVLAGSKQ